MKPFGSMGLNRTSAERNYGLEKILHRIRCWRLVSSSCLASSGTAKLMHGAHQEVQHFGEPKPILAITSQRSFWGTL